MDQLIGTADDRAYAVEHPLPALTDEARQQLGVGLRSLYAQLCEAQPITDVQVDLLLRLRHKERDRRRVA
ncbi:hypothetical protein [Methylobacterium iners]|uniref:Anti-sigma factor NepR domain-containing protein n=1 Tax=Methylobacterium iners TaxID=418707 RepID=A0ABQ4RSP6_9HYPH|nr:hypothetical protein [Methylobacterium iners]GJD93744.1 hypothetical protein OCOJLMKI_0940 [Methylobacterium iners]